MNVVMNTKCLLTWRSGKRSGEERRKKCEGRGEIQRWRGRRGGGKNAGDAEAGSWTRKQTLQLAGTLGGGEGGRID
jgi:hypothetical protein